MRLAPAARSADRTRRPPIATPRAAARGRRLWRDRWMYLLMLPGIVYFVLFHYLPFVGNVIAFQDYSPFLGFRDSPWVGLENFRNLFTDPTLGIALRNTLEISLLQLIFYFPMPIALALLLNSIMSEGVKRAIQSIVYLPHFLSWVIIISLWYQLLGGGGLLNQFLQEQGWPTVNIMTNPDFFNPLVVLQVIWKDIGWGTIIYLAALTKIEMELYEAAAIDGAKGWRRLRDITLPGLLPITILLLILRLGNILDTGFEQMFLQRNAVGPESAEVLDTFVYFRGVQGGDWGFAAAVGLVKTVVGTMLVFSANRIAKWFGQEGAF
ncbi:MAG: ABC transporter permease [Thermomicrobiales bacterium]